MYAGFWRRAASYFVDAVIVFLMGREIGVLFGQTLGIFIAALAGVAYWLVLPVTIGGTLGMRLLGIRLVKTGGKPVGFGEAFIRWLVGGVSLTVLGLGYLWAAWEPYRRTWHDLAAGTYAVRANLDAEALSQVGVAMRDGAGPTAPESATKEGSRRWPWVVAATVALAVVATAFVAAQMGSGGTQTASETSRNTSATSASSSASAQQQQENAPDLDSWCNAKTDLKPGPGIDITTGEYNRTAPHGTWVINAVTPVSPLFPDRFELQPTGVQLADQILNDRANGHFIVVRLAVANNGDSSAAITRQFLLSLLSLTTVDNNRTYDASDMETLMLSPSFPPDHLNPGVTAQGCIVFDVPSDVQPRDLYLHFDSNPTLDALNSANFPLAGQ